MSENIENELILIKSMLLVVSSVCQIGEVEQYEISLNLKAVMDRIDYLLLNLNNIRL